MVAEHSIRAKRRKGQVGPARPDKKSTPGRPEPDSDLHALLNSLNTAIATVRVVQRSLRYLEIAGSEDAALGLALAALDRVQGDLDALSARQELLGGPSTHRHRRRS
jgi:hypothetical protein